jgi:peroxiredoxin/phosphoribosyl 1,2-cyclic phosphodiesterase
MAQQHQLEKVGLKVGDEAPVWSADSTKGIINSGDFLDKHPVLLIFYWADWTSVCSSELPAFEELINFAGDLDFKVFGVSLDNIASHKAYAAQIGLDSIALISDTDGEITDAFGFHDKRGGCKRATVVIGADGVIHHLKVHEETAKPRPLKEVEDALFVIGKLNGITSSREEWKKSWATMMQLPRQTPLEPPTKLTLTFWGTRGSIPVSGKAYEQYGGNTSCVSLTSDKGHLFVFDCGSGARELGYHLLSKEWDFDYSSPDANGKVTKHLKGYILLSHTHSDHIQGFPFFTPVFIPGNRFHIIGWTNCSQTLSSVLAGPMQHCYFPVSLDALPSELEFYSVQHGPFIADGVKIIGTPLKHPIPSTAFRLEISGKTMIYATDHEPLTVPKPVPGVLLGNDVIDEALVELARSADLMIFDAQYSVEQLGQKVGWGHNSGVVGVDTALKAGVKKLVLYHHDPAHDDTVINSLLQAARERAKSFGNPDLEVIAACDNMTLELL